MSCLTSMAEVRARAMKLRARTLIASKFSPALKPTPDQARNRPVPGRAPTFTEEGLMKTSIAIALFALAALPALPTGPAAEAMTISCRDKYVRLREHQDLADALVAVDSRNGKITLLLTESVVAFQLSDRTLHRVRREFREKKAEQDNWFAAAIVTAVAGTVNELIDTSVQCRIRDLRDVSYVDGRLVFTARDGSQIFEDTDMDDCDVVAAFSEHEARKFVREFRSLKRSAGR